MSSPFIGIYTAIYDYQAQNDEELSINENDILYLLQKSDFDDWWLVKKRILDSNSDEPQGLVPKTYIIPLKPKFSAIALYDYNAQTIEELSFNEGTNFNVYDTSDPNWTLVDINNENFGFVPGNYIEIKDNSTTNNNQQPPSQPSQPTNLNLTPFPEPSLSTQSFPPPPQRSDRPTTNSLSNNNHYDNDDDDDDDDDDEQTPPMPARPTTTRSTSIENTQSHQSQNRYNNNNSNNVYSDYEDDDNNSIKENKSKSFFNSSSSKSRSRSNTDSSNKISRKKSISNLLGPHKDDDNINPINGDFAWKIHEIDGKKKRSGILEIGNGKIYLDIDNKLSEIWLISNLINYNIEKKHIFLDFKSPNYSFELHVSNKSSAQAIISILADMKGLQSQSALSDLTKAQNDGIEAAKLNLKRGIILYDFDGTDNDELTCYEGDNIFIINDKKSKEWWMVENSNGERGVVPSNYIKLISNKNKKDLNNNNNNNNKDSSSSSGFLKGLLGPNSKSPKKKSSKDRDREERELREQAKFQHERIELDKQRRRIEQKEKDLINRDREQREKREKIRRADERLRERRIREDSKLNSTKIEKDSNKPNPHRVRTWIDRSGAFKVEAEFLGVQQGKIHLHKLNGVKIAVSCQKLSSEDLEYVERLTGTSLEKYKPQLSKPDSSSSNSTNISNNNNNNNNNIDNSTPSLPSRESSSAVARKRASSVPLRADLVDYWFNFFIEAGVNTAVCDRYATNFAQEQLDKTVLNGITPALMRTLGIREGDILKIKNKIDNLLGKISSPEPILGKSLTDPLPNTPVIKSSTSGGLSDDDWAIKPATNSISDVQPKTITPQITGSIQDLLNVKPMEPTRSSITPVKPVNTIGLSSSTTTTTTPSSTETNSLPNINNGNLGSQKTGNYLNSTTTGIQPSFTGATMPMVAMPTGFMPIIMIPMLTGMTTGIQPLRTGGLTTGLTGGFMNSTITGNMPTTSFGINNLTQQQQQQQQQQQKTGGNGFIMPLNTGTMPTTSFGLPNGMIKLQPTGITLQKTGGNGGLSNINVMQPTMKTGGFIPQSNFGLQLNNSITGGVNPMMTGGLPQTSFGGVNPALTGGFNPALTGGLPQTSFGGVNPALTGGFNPALTGGLPQTSFGGVNPMMTGGLPQTSFGGINPALTGGLPQTSFGGINPALTGGLPPTSFGTNPQQQLPLQSQPTGFGFGNSIVPNSTGRQANLANATADNPFGF